MDDVAKRIEGMSPARQKLLERLNAKANSQVKSYPLSYTQRSMWFLDQLEPNTSLFNMPFARRFRGPMDATAVWRSLREIVQRHESLRTVFPTRGGIAVQEVLPDLPGLEKNIDLGHLAKEPRERALREHIATCVSEPLSLSHGPLFKAYLIRLADDEHVLLFNMHHIISDGWSVYIFFREFDALYGTYSAGGDESPLAPVVLQFGDYAIWQRGWLNSGAMEQQLAFWKDQLGDVAEAVLPTDLARPNVLSHKKGRGIETQYSAEISAHMGSFCRTESATPFMVMLAAFQIALAKYLGARDFALGTPVAGRTRIETESILGCFINTLAIRSDIADATTFRTLVRRVRERTLAAYEHQDLPFERLVEAIVSTQTLSRSPLFQVMYSFENFPSSNEVQEGLTFANEDIGPSRTRMEMTLTVTEHDGDYRSVLEYDGDLYRPERMAQMMSFLERILEESLRCPDAELAATTVLSGDQLRALAALERGAVDSGAVGSVGASLARCAAEHPGATALIHDAGTLSYGGLNQRANRVASFLRDQAVGAGAEAMIGVLLERGEHLHAAVLGIFKAGATYVPLDPGFPSERLVFMASDAALKVLVVDEHTRHLAPVGAWAVLDLTAQREALAATSDADVDQDVHADQLACVIYTSGSSGRPKGTGLTYRGLENQLRWVPRAFGLSASDRFLQKTSISFDASLGEMLAPLMAGGSVVIAKPRGEYDVSYLAGLVDSQAVTCVDLAPSLLRTLLEQPDIGAWRGVRLVVCGAEAMPRAVVQMFRSRLPQAVLLNAYGPTEATIQSTWTSDLDALDAVPIGRPVANTSVYVLDDRMQRVPPGTRGELYIAGDGVARGYVGRPGLTADRFVPNPFGGGDRLYRTGDMARWRDDGQLDFLGRIDHQIKLRGYRIELGEIEQVLQQHPGIRSAAVSVRDEGGVVQLVAYLVSKAAEDRHALEVDGLRTHLANALPAYMIPALFVWLDALPLTRAGKLDRTGLPAPDGTAFSLRAYEPPRAGIESDVARMFQDVLKLERVGRHDSFFELGGHSLLAVQLISRVHRVFGREFRLLDLFTHPTVERIAEALTVASSSRLPAVEAVPHGAEMPLSFAQEALWFLDHIDGAGRAYHMPLGMRLKGALDHDALGRALDHLMARHDVLRATFPAVDGAGMQRIAAAGQLAFPWVLEDASSGDRATWDALIRREIATPFDLARGPLVRGRLIRLGTDDHVLLITMHHIISDGWSIGLFMREFATLYRAFHAQEASPLPALLLQYADYVAWQRQLLAGTFLEQQQDYWVKQLAGAPPLLTLPTDRPRPLYQDFVGEVVGFELDEALTEGLRRLSRTHGATLYMTLLAGWSLLLSRLSGQSDVVVGTPSANRLRQELEDLIGLFANMLALRVEVDAAVTVAGLIERVKATFLAAQQHEHLPFEQVVALVRPERNLAYNPLFQAMLVWEGGSRGAAAALPGLVVEGVDMGPSRTAKFDLTLGLEDRGTHIAGGMEFATALFDRAAIERFTGYFIALLRGMVADPAQHAMGVPMISPAEGRQVLVDWNATALDFPGALYAHQWIEWQAQQSPDAVAVVHGDNTLTYAQLDRRASQLAHHLRGLGVGPEERVALCVERGTGMLVGLLAVLKAGGAYVPMDPAYPAERLRAMLDDSAPVVLLTQRALATRFTYTGSVVDVDDTVIYAGEPVSPIAPAEIGLQPGSLAYLIYTSGSTGMPKGVMLEHANLMHFLAWGRSAYAPPALARTLAATSLSFDLAVFECLLPLTCGQAVHVVADVLDLARGEVPVTLINTVPSAMEALLDAGSLPAQARIANLAGEPLKPALVARIFDQSAVDAVYNLYGPTETTTYSTVARIARGETFGGHIGRPIANTQIYILDGRGQPAPIGVAGELCIGGAGVARGYFKLPALTKERFLDDPFATTPGTRMYRTGDLARWLADGTIEFLGRADHQVKLRGYRIELGEIERVLEEREDVQQAVVMVREDRPGIRELVAYIVATSANATVEAWRAHLAARLPAYMVPAAFIVLHSLPLTPNGKLDRKALPPVDAHDAGHPGANLRTCDRDAAVGATEERIARIFQEILGVDDIGRHDDFFALGGHSLLSLRLISQLRSTYEVDLTLAKVFEVSSVAKAAAWIEGPLNRTARACSPSICDLPAGIVRLRDGDDSEPLFLIHPIGGSVICYVPLARLLATKRSVFGIETVIAHEPPRLESLETIASKYVKHICSIQPAGPYHLGGWSLGGLFAWEIARQLRGQGEDVALLAMLDTYPQRGESAMDVSALRDVAIDRFRADLTERMIDEEDNSSRRDVPSIESLHAMLVGQGMVAASGGLDQVKYMLGAYERNTWAMEHYIVQPADQKAVLFVAESGDPDVLIDAWRGYSGGGVTCHLLAENHYSLMKASSLNVIASTISAALRR